VFVYHSEVSGFLLVFLPEFFAVFNMEKQDALYGGVVPVFFKEREVSAKVFVDLGKGRA
jgi:hypothetical protein